MCIYNCAKHISSNTQVNDQKFTDTKYKFHFYFSWGKFQTLKTEKHPEYMLKSVPNSHPKLKLYCNWHLVQSIVSQPSGNTPQDCLV